MTISKEPQQAFLRISETARLTKETATTIRSWETKFPQIRPVKRSGGHRYFRRETINLLLGISYLIRKAGFTVEGVQRIFRKHGERAVRQIGIRRDLSPLSRPKADSSLQPGTADGMTEETRTLLLSAAAELREAARLLQA